MIPSDLTGFTCSTCGLPVTMRSGRIVHSDDTARFRRVYFSVDRYVMLPVSTSDYDHEPTIDVIEVRPSSPGLPVPP